MTPSYANVESPSIHGSIRCPHCENLVDLKARFCSRCGLSLPPQETALPQQWIVPLIGGSIVFLLTLAVLLVPVGGTPAVVEQRIPMRVAAMPVTPQATPARPTTTGVKPVVPTATEDLPSERATKRKPVLFRSPMLGATTGGGPFESYSRTREALIGLQVATAPWMNNRVLRTFEPIWPSSNVVYTPSMVVAKPGYAVGGLIADGDESIYALKVMFMRVGPDGELDTADHYESDWIGRPKNKAAHLLGGSGERVVGVYGRRGLNVDAVGLISLERQTPAETGYPVH